MTTEEFIKLFQDPDIVMNTGMLQYCYDTVLPDLLDEGIPPERATAMVAAVAGILQLIHAYGIPSDLSEIMD